MPLVSVVVTSYNHARYVWQAIDSILAQTFTGH
jgi:glycosyltransferase involved in cell wall biosynthesis